MRHSEYSLRVYEMQGIRLARFRMPQGGGGQHGEWRMPASRESNEIRTHP